VYAYVLLRGWRSSDLSVAVGRLGVVLRDAADDDVGRSYSAVDPREQLVAAAHLTDVHPARVAGRAEVSPQQLHVRLVRPLVAQEDRRRNGRLVRVVVHQLRYTDTRANSAHYPRRGWEMK